MSEEWTPSRTEHDVIVAFKSKAVNPKRGLHDTEIIKRVENDHPKTYSKTEIQDAITILSGKRYLEKIDHSSRIPAMRDRFTNKITVPARTHKLIMFNLSDKALIYLRNTQDTQPEAPGIQLFQSTEPYSVRRLFEGLFGDASSDIKIIDNYIGKKTLDYLMNATGKGITIQIMTSSYEEAGFNDAFTDFEQQYSGSVEIKVKQGKFHGRVIIIDGQAYIIDHSIKDFGSKPSSITKVEEPEINSTYNDLFTHNWADS